MSPRLYRWGHVDSVVSQSGCSDGAAVTAAQCCGEGSAPSPDFLTVEEAARVVRIGRTTAYDLARQFLATGGREGLPVVRFGKQLRVPRCRLEEALGGPISWPPSTDANVTLERGFPAEEGLEHTPLVSTNASASATNGVSLANVQSHPIAV